MGFGANTVMTVEVFKTRFKTDNMTVVTWSGASKYSGAGARRPPNSTVSRISWTSDSNLNRPGWKICTSLLPAIDPGRFVILGTGCRPDATDDTCITSKNYPAKYDNKQKCEILFGANSFVTVEAFKTQANKDIMTWGGMNATEQYSGNWGGRPTNSIASRIGWTSDFNTRRKGWKICSTPTTQDPSPMPQPAPLIQDPSPMPQPSPGPPPCHHSCPGPPGPPGPPGAPR